jgi:hypothetical protein
MSLFRHSLSLCALALSLSFAGCGDDGGADEPAVFVCLYDSASCSFGSLGGECPPAASDWSTQCIDSSDGWCVSEEMTSEFDGELGQTFYVYTSNPRVVEGVTCEDYNAMPEVDPDPLEPTCAWENDGTCDAGGSCPEGTDVADCATPTCEPVAPDASTCDGAADGALWCTNVDGGESCAEGAEIWLCENGAWALASDASIREACEAGGYSAYFGCAGSFDDFVGYCE